jgi:hypothetical protein
MAGGGGVGGRRGVYPRAVSTFNDIIGGCHLPSMTSGPPDTRTSTDRVLTRRTAAPVLPLRASRGHAIPCTNPVQQEINHFYYYLTSVALVLERPITTELNCK